MKKPIPTALVDCNNFYASCERVFNPKLNGKPILVLSNNDGMIIARSNEAKALGIQMGQPLFKVQDAVRKNKVHVFSSNYTLYGDLSQRVMATLETFSPNVEIYSIDEAFVNLDGFEYRDLNEYCKEIKQTVQKWVGIPVSIGVAETKTLAKLANRFAKKNPECNGVLNLIGIDNIDYYLKKTDVEDIWGVGRQYTKLLMNNGINNAYDLKNANEKWIKKNMTVMGMRTVYELRGIPCIPYQYMPPAKQSIVSSRSFGKATQLMSEVKEAIAYFTTIAAEKLRRQNSATKNLGVFLRTNPFKDVPQYHNGVIIELPVPTDSTSELITYSERGVEQIFKEGFLYYKVGVMLSDFVNIETVQPSLFDTKDREKQAKITHVLDKINNDLGSHSLFYAATGVNRAWKTRVERKSPNYTTSWKELPIVK